LFDPIKLEKFARDPLFFLTAVLALGILAQWVAWRLRLPSILLLLAFGFGARYFGVFDPNSVLGEDLLFALVSVFVAIILFEGGLTLQLHEIRESASVIFRLVFVGAVVTWILTALAAHYLLGMDPRVAALTGAVLVVTGPTVIAPLLRHIRPARKVASIVKWEGIVIDPIGALLAVLVFEAIFVAGAEVTGHSAHHSATLIAMIVGKTLLVGGVIAIVTAVLLVQLLKRYWIPDFLHNSVFLAIAVFTFTLSNALQHESGLVTVTLLGVLLANQRSVPVRHVLEFKENLRVLLISCLFIILSARIELSQLGDLGWSGLGLLFLLIALIRPLSVFVSCLGAKLSWRERVFLAFLAPRGIVAAAVSSIFALRVGMLAKDLGHQVPVGTAAMVPMTFLVIVGTVAFYGLFSPFLARWLDLASPNPQGILFAGASQWIRQIAKTIHDLDIPVLLVDTNYRNVSLARQDGLPSQCASVLSEYIDEEVDLAEIGRLLAVTPNDDLNRLAVLEYSPDFGRAGVYQLNPLDGGSSRRDTASPHIQGRLLFAPDVTYYTLAARMNGGAQIKRTRITDEFTFEDFQEMYSESLIVLFVVTEGGQLNIATADAPLVPKAGQTVIALVDPVAEEDG
jgi:NhaP-type Na+/H+ or K+/H+ antiporter